MNCTSQVDRFDVRNGEFRCHDDGITNACCVVLCYYDVLVQREMNLPTNPYGLTALGVGGLSLVIPYHTVVLLLVLVISVSRSEIVGTILHRIFCWSEPTISRTETGNFGFWREVNHHSICAKHLSVEVS